MITVNRVKYFFQDVSYPVELYSADSAEVAYVIEDSGSMRVEKTPDDNFVSVWIENENDRPMRIRVVQIDENMLVDDEGHAFSIGPPSE